MENLQKELINQIKRIGEKHGIWNVFEDFLTISSISISNAFDFDKKREEDYLKVIKKYNPNELNEFAKLLALLTNLLNSFSTNPQDVLGDLFHKLELHNKYKGQFFTPNHICKFMGKALLTDVDNIINRKGYISILEPTCGSGALILGAADALASKNFNYQKQMLVTAIDIDLKCVFMTYIQLSLFGIPAIVIHGNALTVEEWSRWYTPMYFIGSWQYKNDCHNTNLDNIASILKSDNTGQLAFF